MKTLPKEHLLCLRASDLPDFKPIEPHIEVPCWECKEPVWAPTKELESPDAVPPICLLCHWKLSGWPWSTVPGWFVLEVRERLEGGASA